MRYLQKQRKSVVSDTGFRRYWSLLLGAMILLASAIPQDVSYILEQEQVTAICEEPDSCARHGTQILSAPTRRTIDAQYTNRQLYGLRAIEQVEQRTAFCYRYLQQIRLLVWYLLAGFLVLPELFCQRFGDGRVRQRELVSRSRMITSYIKKADGKKNGFTSFIK